MVLRSHMGAIAEQLRAVRKRAGLTGTDLGPIVGYEGESSHASVSKVENGQIDPPASKVEAWVAACDAEILIVPKRSREGLSARAAKLDDVGREIVSLFVGLVDDAADTAPPFLELLKFELTRWRHALDARKPTGT